MSKRNTVLKELLLALLPFSENNLLLTYKPHKFFSELEQKTAASRNTLAATMSRAKKNNLLKIDEEGIPKLTWRGKKKIKVALGTPLKKQRLIVVFDIPESEAASRRELRGYLISQKFKYIQKSVWASSLDVTDELIEVIAELRLGKYVQILLAETVYP
jgi:DNA-binding transcriptional regulator PaaX